jgi:fluoroquinolone transport system ATP-binding protein
MMIQVDHLYHDYTGQGHFAVSDVSFAIDKGEIFGFLGPSGAGKSTVQNIMIGLLPLQRGQIQYKGQPITTQGHHFFNGIGVSFELPNLYTKLTGYENLKYFSGLYDVPVMDPMILLDMVGLKDAAHKRASAYSKGMKQRLVFARSLVNRPEILFLDEPTSGLDPTTASRIKDIIMKKKAEGTTIFLTTHNMTIADELCDRVAFINDGVLVGMDTPRNLKLQYGEKSVMIEYIKEGVVNREVIFIDRQEDIIKLNSLLNAGQIQMIHSQEATLEQIFIKLTGRGLQ